MVDVIRGKPFLYLQHILYPKKFFFLSVEVFQTVIKTSCLSFGVLIHCRIYQLPHGAHFCRAHHSTARSKIFHRRET
uniref:Uncharacterized protein n=1 Tax=Ascaris lumbricoides TaxID=6252 RepID=A0A0M3IGJ8_ASCLU